MKKLSNVTLEHSKKADYFQRFDYFLLVAVLAVTAIGLVFLSSAQYDRYEDHGEKAMLVQLVGLAIGVVLCIVMTFFDYRTFKKIYIPFYAFNILLMVVVFLPGIGIESGGSRSWLNLGFTTYQPAEMMKLAMVIFVSVQMEKARKEGMTKKNAILILGGFWCLWVLFFSRRTLVWPLFTFLHFWC